MSNSPSFLTRAGHALAYHRHRGSGPGIVWLGGFHSDMEGGKALAVDAAAQAAGRAFVRFDYFGHGQSEGAFAAGTVSTWRDDALAVIDDLTDGPQILVGSSMGGWIALLCALARPERVTGLVLIAPAPDFTERLMWDGFSDAVRAEILETGQWMRPSEYDPEGYPITKALIEDGRQHRVLDKPTIPVTAPVRILQGMDDADVPWRHALETAEKLASDDVALTLVKGGDHRLSTDPDLARLIHTVMTLGV